MIFRCEEDKLKIKGFDTVALASAVSNLERKTFASRLTDASGKPIALALDQLPLPVQRTIQQVSRTAIENCLGVAIRTMGDGIPWNDSLARGVAVFTGLIGGAFGLAGLCAELPITTVVMLRSIAEIARGEGENLSSSEAKLACIEVFALSNSGPTGDTYYAIRTLLAQSLDEAASFITERGILDESTPAIVRFITNVASRFGIVISEEAAASCVPIIGALGGAAINGIFIDHFIHLAHGHFTIRRLERQYGSSEIRAAYGEIVKQMIAPHLSA
jgi:hypothetical protein